MANLDLAFVRQQFPAFSEPALQNTVFLENAGGSYMCQQVIDRLTAYYHQCKIQPYYPNPTSMHAGAMMDEAYGAMANWLNVNEEQIYFGPSTSQNTYVLAQAMLGWLKAGDEIIVTNQDHEANVGAWRRLESHGIHVKEWQVDPSTGSLDLEKLEILLSNRTKLLTFPHCSNILGEINPVKQIVKAAKAYDTRCVVDGVSFAGHGLPDVKDLGADVYLFSLYKVYGPHQGVMVINDEMAANLASQSHYFLSDTRVKRLMPSGPDHAQIAAVKGIDDYFNTLYQHHFPSSDNESYYEKSRSLHQLFRAAEHEAVTPLLEYIQDTEKLVLLGPSDPNKRAVTISVIPNGISPTEIAAKLGSQGIMCGAGHYYSARLLAAMDLDPNIGVLRFSLVHYNSKRDTERLVVELGKIF